ncbi:MAG: F0F1 ATP synthase subunit delta [Jatrophihabitans sp.]
MHAASREALTALRERLEAVTGRFSTSDGLSGLSQELYAVAEVLNGQPRLRRALADPSTSATGRADLAGRLLEGKVGASALQIVREAVSLRWSASWDLVDSLELIADEALFSAAEQDGIADRIEDELFRFERILDAQSELTVLLDEASATADRRVALLDSVLGDKVHPITRQLLSHAVSSRRKHTVSFAIDELLEAASRRRNRSVARVVSAVELTTEQQSRLTAALTELYHRPISVRIALDPMVRGGLVVHIGDEVIDGSVAARLTQARSALAG